MFSRANVLVRIGIVALSGMFLMGQDAWQPPTVRDRVVFITSYPLPCSYFTVADVACQAFADLAGLSGTFKAWVSTSTSWPATSFTKDGRFVYVKRQYLIAYDWDDLMDGQLQGPINLDEYGNRTDDDFVLTGTGNDGAPHWYDSLCDNWTTCGAPTTTEAVYGASTAKDWRWTEAGSRRCDTITASRMYCFEQ